MIAFFGDRITIKITFASFETVYHYIILNELSERFEFCKSTSSGLLVLLFLKHLFTTIKRV